MTTVLKGLAPLVLLAVLLALFFQFGPLGVFQAAFPPVEELSIQRVELPAANQIVVRVFNGGASPVTLAQVLVDDAFWSFSTQPEDRTIPRLGNMLIRIPYPWVEGETHQVRLLTSTGLTFDTEIGVATQTPEINWTYLWSFSLLGIYAGVIPVMLGLLWYPFLRQISSRWIHFFLSLTAGLLLFLAIDTLEEALETTRSLPDVMQGIVLVLVGSMGTVLMLFYLGRLRPERADKTTPQGRFWTALMIALGIGLHNLGEGLAIGSSYSIGEIALGTFLVVGFLLHNVTEGLGILAPLARDRVSLSRIAWLGLLAGVPTVFGTWIGAFGYSPLWTTVFLAVGAGAIFQVMYEVGMIVRRGQGGWLNGYNLSGFFAGLSIMYATALLTVA